MSDFVPWNSQPLDKWARRYAKGQFIDLGGRLTHVIKLGTGPNVILIHGFFLDCNTWRHNIKALAERFTVYAPDLWGFGYSTRRPLEYGYALYTEQIRRLMDALDIEKASLVGHSMGGGTAINFTVTHPERVERLLLVDSVGMPNPLPLRSRLFNLPGVAEACMALRGDTFRKMNLKDLWFYKSFELSNGEFKRLVRFHKVEGTTQCLATILRKEFFNTLEGEINLLATTNHPVKLVWGKQDKAVPLHRGKAMHEALQRSRLQVFRKTGHTAPIERPEAFNEQAIRFLT